MTKPIYTIFITFLFLSFSLMSYTVSAQEYVDDPNLDQIPQWYLDSIQKWPRQNSEVITINDYDNFYLGLDFAEGHISVNPMEPTQFFTAYNIDDSHYTMDGHNWEDSNPDWGVSMRGDPITAYDSLGNLYYENMYGSSILGCKIVKSSDNGQTWSSAVNAISGNDKNWLACDQTSGPYANYVYTTMTNNGSGNFVRSTDFGQTWQSTFNPSTQALPGMMVCVGADQNISGGSVYVVTNSGSSFASTYTFYESNDGGETFNLKSAQNFAGYVGRNISGRNSVENMRTRPYPFITADNSTGPYRGRLHLVYATNDPPGDGNKPDIWSRYSDDGGSTWSSAKRVNSGFTPQQSHQWQPATWCDKETGRLYIQWMDTRDTPTNDSAMIYATYSDNGGQSFEASTKISNEKMKVNCNTCGGGGTPRYQGDYSGIVSNTDVSMATWSDFRWGSFATFTGYFPDFAMRVYPTTKQISFSDTIWAVIPETKLYDNEAIFSATIETPGSGTFTIDFPNGNSLTNFPDSIPIVVTVDAVPPGEYLMTIKGEGPNGTPIHFRDAIVDVLPLVAPVVNFSVNDTITCDGSSVNFTDESTNGPSSWLWTFEGGDPATSTEKNPLGILYATSGSYDVTLEATNSSGSNTLTMPDFMVVNTSPDAPIADSKSTCENMEIPSLEAEGADILWYSNPDLTELVYSGNIFNTGNTLPGEYTYYTTQSIDGCESDAIEVVLIINMAPEVTFGQLDTVCYYSTSFELTVGIPEGGTYNGPGVIDGMFDAQMAGEGTHTLSYFYENANLCADTAFQNITVRALTPVILEPLASVCSNAEPFELTGGIPEGGNFSGDGIVDNYYYPASAGSGEHIVNYSIVDGNDCSNSTYETITVFGQPQVNIGADTTICGSETITLNATVANATSYLWTPGDFTTPTITIDSSGIGYNSQEFIVVVIDENTCEATDATTITFKNCTGIEEIVGLEKVSIYPNPNDGSFYLNITSSKAITVDLKVTNAVGVNYLEENNLEIVGDYSTVINIQDVKSGLYFISLTDDKGVFIKKFLVK